MARILIAEDEDTLRRFVARALAMDGHDIVEAADGAEALEHIEAEAFDLLLSDIRMPVMDGIALATATADLTPAMPILLMTGYAEQRERAEPLMRIVVDVVEKPFTLPQIRQAVADALMAKAA
ncbi:MAG: response regulator [Hoeflea sp.]|uniref:response regulator n=1 Tax=Hoeflea sp. TaxID=1940281 RepID=UPI001DA7A4D6|nr:response regulator [Hoeflea sp.]MBU4528650.1 response regulator [Alphaproteobacteria bacterium]MBU4545545.1 response regulator [Alphaproteobacteria bacterium]MBU4552155.1 response regulator [Alphaproteobacteria bacterium]MBV1726253.1 response regulator [Hoeflea sp.]MBV1762320.1 response regulator [Hoeflea sp.]